MKMASIFFVLMHAITTHAVQFGSKPDDHPMAAKPDGQRANLDALNKRDESEIDEEEEYCGVTRDRVQQADFIHDEDADDIIEFCKENKVSIAFTLTCQQAYKKSDKNVKRAFDPINAKTIIDTSFVGLPVGVSFHGYVGYWDETSKVPGPHGIVVDEEKLTNVPDKCIDDTAPTKAEFSVMKLTNACLKDINKAALYIGGYGIHAMFKNGKHLFEHNADKAELLSKLNERICHSTCGKMTARGRHLLVDEGDTDAMIRQGDFVLTKMPVSVLDEKNKDSFQANALAPDSDAPLYWILPSTTVEHPYHVRMTKVIKEHQELRKFLSDGSSYIGKHV